MKVVMLDMVNTKSQIIVKIWAYYLENNISANP